MNTMAQSEARRAVGSPVAIRTESVSGRRTHLTRRGRVVVVVGLALLLFAAFSLGRQGAEGATEAVPAPQLQHSVVEPGETLWEVAKRIAPGRDPRPVIEQIRQLNDLPGSGLQAGQELVLPVAG